MVIFLTKEQMEKLTTKRLLAYKNSIMKKKQNEEGYDEAYANVRTILATREHVERKK